MTGRIKPWRDPWSRMRSATQARIALGRSGAALPTTPLLDFQLAHARARDAVHTALDVDRLIGQPGLDQATVVHSRAPDRTTYLQQPGEGRRIGDGDVQRLQPGAWDLAIAIGDGLSATAVDAHAAPLVSALVSRLPGWRIAPPVIALQARVAIGDEIGERLAAAIVVMLIGERPGLSSADSLGAYITFAPRVGRRDHERNCVSNIRPPDGLSYESAAGTLAWLLNEARRRQLTGVDLKDESGGALLPG